MNINTQFEFTTFRKNIFLKLISNSLILLFLSLGNIVFGVYLGQIFMIALGLSLIVLFAYILTLFFAESNKNKNPYYIFNYGYIKYESLFIIIHLFLSIFIAFIIFSYYVTMNKKNVIANIDNQLYTLIVIFFSSLIVIFLKKIFDKNLQTLKNVDLYFNYIIWKNVIILNFLSFISLCFTILFYQSNNSKFSNYLDYTLTILILAYNFITPIKNLNFAFNHLLEKTADDEKQFNILAVIVENIKNYCEFRSLYVRTAGKKLFIEIDIVLPYDYTIEQKYALERKFEEQIKAIYPNSITRLYVIPCSMECLRDGKFTCPIKNKTSN